VLVAKDLTSCRAWDTEASEAFELEVRGNGIDIWASGVAVRGMYAELEFRDGVNGAEVGTIRDCCLAPASSRAPGGGWACGRLNPGGAEGVDEREIPPKSLGGSMAMNSLALSATRASTDIDASSSDGRTWSSINSIRQSTPLLMILCHEKER
jgi:hypothetical protein